MSKYFVDGQDLTDIADAIREKTGKSVGMEFPDEFVSEIGSISSGGVTPTGTINITQNGTTDVTEYASANVAVPNSYAAADEGKVVSNGALVAQTSKNISANGTVDTTLNNQAVVAVPNSYSASDEGKVVSNGALVAQGSDTVTANGVHDTTLIKSLTVNVSGGGGGSPIIDYVDTTGSCAVNLGMGFSYPSTGYTLGVKFGVLSNSTTQIVYSGSNAVSGSTDQLVIVSGKLRTDMYTTTQRFAVSVGDTIRQYASGLTSWKGVFAIDETSGAGYGSNATIVTDLQNPKNMVLFAEYKNNTYQTFATVRFYEFFYIEGGTEIIHLYPAKDSNNVKCLYDTVTSSFFYPSTGSFA